MDLITQILDVLLDLQPSQLAVLAGVTIAAAAIIYVLLDALRFRAIPELDVSLTPGV